MLSQSSLVERLVNCLGGPNRPVVFMIGSGAAAPEVPLSRDIVERIRRLEPSGISNATTYQEAFQILIDRRGRDAANIVVRDAVLEACESRPQLLGDDSLSELEVDWQKWKIPLGISALAALAEHHPSTFGRAVLTTNFDPLIEIALTRAGVPWHSTALHRDGSLLHIRGSGASVAHLHGYWRGGDTLHTHPELRRDRPELEASLRRILSKSVVVVLGYGGWDDVFTTALQRVVAENDSVMDLLWSFHDENEDSIRERNCALLKKLAPEATSGRVQYFKGVDANSVLPELFLRVCEKQPAESIGMYLDRVLFTLARPSAYLGLKAPWNSWDSASFFVQPLSCFSEDEPSRAAIRSVQLMLSMLEGQPVNQAPLPQHHSWVRPALAEALGMIDTGNPTKVESVLDNAKQALKFSVSLSDSSQEETILRASAYALAATVASLTGSCALEGREFSAIYWAGRAVHLIGRALYDRNELLVLHLKAALSRQVHEQQEIT